MELQEQSLDPLEEPRQPKELLDLSWEALRQLKELLEFSQELELLDFSQEAPRQLKELLEFSQELDLLHILLLVWLLALQDRATHTEYT